MNKQSNSNGTGSFQGIPLDIKLKGAVHEWRQKEYDGATPVTKRLLQYWFFEDHFDDKGYPLKFWDNQREAIEALIYIYEVAKLHSLNELQKAFEVNLPLTYQRNWPVYGFKMATGSGKTIVMEMAIVWQYFNYILGSNSNVRYSNRFLILAPNLIVLDRLYEGSFKNLEEIKKLPFIPPEWTKYLDIQVVYQAEKISKSSKGIIYLTNIQQLYEREKEPKNPVDAILGEKPKKENDPLVGWEYLITSLTKEENLVVINDEAHHVYYNIPNEWYNSIKNINDLITQKFGRGLTMQLDFSATPKNKRNEYWGHIIYDYPLRNAIRDKIVKKVHIGILGNILEPPKSNDYVTKNKAQIDIGFQKLEEIKKELNKINKKPVMFIMCDKNKNANKVADYLKTKKNLDGKVLLIHTDASGEITKSDIPFLREAARNIDNNQYEVIVSVMMLKEGWDVRNVVVIVPLRPFDSPLLPEQTLGRGLRKMQPNLPDNEEILLVIDHPKFRALWEAEIKSGNLEADINDIKKIKVEVHAIMPDSQKIQYDMQIPILEGGILKWEPDFSNINLNKYEKNKFKIDEINPPPIRYTEKDLLTQKKVKEERINFIYTDNYEIYLSYITNDILKRNKIPTIYFNQLVPFVSKYIENYLFTNTIDITDPNIISKLNDFNIREYVINLFSKIIKELYDQYRSNTNIKPIYYYYKISDTQVMHTSVSMDMLYAPKKSVFNYLPADSTLEVEFMKYLDQQEDVIAYTKIFKNMMPLHILYYDMKNIARYYIPDFIVKAKCGSFIIETKGRELDNKENVRYKDKAADEWCKKISKETGENWKYVKIISDDFSKNRDLSFCGLVKKVGYKRD